MEFPKFQAIASQFVDEEYRLCVCYQQVDHFLPEKHLKNKYNIYNIENYAQAVHSCKYV